MHSRRFAFFQSCAFYTNTAMDEWILRTILCLPLIDVANGILKRQQFMAIAQPIKFLLVFLMLVKLAKKKTALFPLCFAYMVPFFLSDFIQTAIKNDLQYAATNIGDTIKNSSLIVACGYFSILRRQMPKHIASEFIALLLKICFVTCAANIIAGTIGVGYPQYTYYLPSGEVIGIGAVGFFYDGNTLSALLLLSSVYVAASAFKKSAQRFYIASIFLFVLSFFKATKSGILGTAIIVFMVPVLHYAKAKFTLSIKKITMIVPLLAVAAALSPIVYSKITNSSMVSRLSVMANKTDPVTFLLSDRNLFLRRGMAAYENYSLMDQMFGSGYRYTEDVASVRGMENKTIEIDLFDILLEKGLACVMLSYLLWGWLFVRSLLYFNRDPASWGVPLIINGIFIILSFTSGHIVGSGVLGFYIAAVNLLTPKMDIASHQNAPNPSRTQVSAQ